MKKTMSTEKIIEYYIKLAKKESKHKKVYIQRKNGLIYFSNGEFIASFATIRKEALVFLQETFNFAAGEDDFCLEVLGDYCKNSETTIAEYVPTTLEDGSLLYIGVSAEDTRKTVYAFSDGEKLFVYDEKYVRPIKWGTFSKAHLPNSIYTMCIYTEIDIEIAVLPNIDRAQFEKIAKLMNR